MTVASGLGLVLSVAMAWPAVDFVLFAMTSLATVYLSLMMGTWAAEAHGRLEAHRHAIQAQQLAEHADRVGRLRTGLTGMLALRHDQRTLMQSMALELDELDAVVTEPSSRAALSELQLTFRRLRTLVVEGGQATLEPESELELVPVSVRDAAADGARVVEAARVTLSMTISPALPAVLVRGGPVALGRVLLNVLVNASEGDGGPRKPTRVDLSASLDETGRRVVVRVCDDGPGFPPGVLSRRAPFQTTKAHGSGLGLITAESYVRASGGELTLRNPSEGGAEVTLLLLAEGPR